MRSDIRKCSIPELENAANIKDLLAEYAAESAIAGLPAPSAKFDMYRSLEESGALHVIGAFSSELLIGYITVLAPVLPHYSAVVAVTESFFVAKEHRKSGAGIKLLREAESYAKTKGSPGLLVSAPFGGDLAEVLPRVGYEETNRVFFKSFSKSVALSGGNDVIPSMSKAAIDKVREMETLAFKMPQVQLDTTHVLHGGMYARTVRLPAGVMITGALIKVASTLIIQGDVLVYTGDETRLLEGYNVLPAEAMRKQAFVAKTEAHLTMIFPTNAQTIEDAENEFTDEAGLLMSRQTKERICQA